MHYVHEILQLQAPPCPPTIILTALGKLPSHWDFPAAPPRLGQGRQHKPSPLSLGTIAGSNTCSLTAVKVGGQFNCHTAGSETVQGPCSCLTEQYNSQGANPCTSSSSQMIPSPGAPSCSHGIPMPRHCHCLERQVPVLALVPFLAAWHVSHSPPLQSK